MHRTKNMPRRYGHPAIFLAVAVAIAALSAGCQQFSAWWDQNVVGHPEATTSPSDSTSQPAPLGPSDMQSLAAMSKEPVKVPVTPPTGVKAPAPASQPLPAQGLQLLDRRCRMEQQGKSKWFVLKFEQAEGQPAEPPRWVLPCKLLEEMEKALAADPKVAFKVSGENVVYKNLCYIYLSQAGIDTADEPSPAPTSRPAKSRPSPEAQPAYTVTAPAATGKPAEPAPASADDVMDTLLKEKAAKPIAVEVHNAVEDVTPASSVAPGGDKTIFPPDRPMMVVDRLVRFQAGKDGAWWEARFESDNTLGEPPLRVLPCQLLEKAQGAAGSDSVLVRVSGEITIYKGHRYLLLRKFVPQPRIGQF